MLPNGVVQSVVCLCLVWSPRTCESRRKKQVQAFLGDPKESQPSTGPFSAKLYTFTDDATFASVGFYGTFGNLDRPGRISSAEKSVIIFDSLLILDLSRKRRL